MKFRDSISNYFDRLLKGIGHRGSSFTDIDALTHDEATDRFLFQEFKALGEELSVGQARYLKALARRDFITVWCVRRLGDGRVEWCDVATRERAVISEQDYRSKFAAWWNNGEQPKAVAPAASVPDLPLSSLTAADIQW